MPPTMHMPLLGGPATLALLLVHAAPSSSYAPAPLSYPCVPPVTTSLFLRRGSSFPSFLSDPGVQSVRGGRCSGPLSVRPRGTRCGVGSQLGRGSAAARAAADTGALPADPADLQERLWQAADVLPSLADSQLRL